MKHSTAAARTLLTLATLLVLAECATAGPCPIRIPADHHPGWEQQLDARISDLSDRRTVRIVIFGDTGKAKGFAPVAREIVRACAQRTCDLGLMLGDNFYIPPFRAGPKSPDSRHFESVFYAPLAGLGAGFDVWPVLGNHGYRGCPQAQIDHTYGGARPGRPDWLMPNNALSVPKLPAWLHVYTFDSELVLNPERFKGSGQDHAPARAKHLEGIVKAFQDRRGWRVLVGHHPLYTTGDHGRDENLEELRSLLGPLVADLGVHLYLAGHDHDAELIRKGSFLQVVQGSGSRLRERPQKPYQLPAGATTLGFWARPGFAIATFEEDSLELEYFLLDGKTGKLETRSWTWQRSELEDGEGR